MHEGLSSWSEAGPSRCGVALRFACAPGSRRRWGGERERWYLVELWSLTEVLRAQCEAAAEKANATISAGMKSYLLRPGTDREVM